MRPGRAVRRVARCLGYVGGALGMVFCLEFTGTFILAVVGPTLGAPLLLGAVAGFVRLVRATTRGPRGEWWTATWRLHGVRPRALLVVVAVGVVAYATSMGIILATYTVRGPWDAGAQPDTGVSAAEVVAMLVVAPVVEEFVFRGWLQRSLEREVGPVAAIAVTAVLFARLHDDSRSFANRLLLGGVYGVVGRTTDSIWACVAAHAVNNAGALLFMYAIPRLGLASNAAFVPWVTAPATRLAATAVAVGAGLGLSCLLVYLARSSRLDRRAALPR